MSQEVEELSEDMKRESDAETRKAMGKTQLAFIDLENMSAFSCFLWIVFASAVFGSIGYFFYTQLFQKEE